MSFRPAREPLTTPKIRLVIGRSATAHLDELKSIWLFVFYRERVGEFYKKAEVFSMLTAPAKLTARILKVLRSKEVPNMKGWVPAGVEGPAAVPIFFIEVISQFVRIVSLSVRLFANILAGHLLILFMGGGLVVLLNLALIGSLVLGLVTGTLAVAFFIFEVGLVATLQAFIFTILAAIYLGGAVAEEH